MRISAAKISLVIAIGAVAALGAQYASAAPSQQAHTAIAPLRNIDYQYSTTTTGGTGDVAFTIPNPPNGIYAATFTANFNPEGTPAAPETFSCSLIKDGVTQRAQSTISTPYSSGFYAGVNGGNTIKIDHVAQFQMFCGTDDNTAWTWGSRSLQVNLVRIDGVTSGNLTQSAKRAGSLSVVGTH